LFASRAAPETTPTRPPSKREAKKPTKQKNRPSPRHGKPRPRDRHAVARSDTSDASDASDEDAGEVANPVNQRVARLDGKPKRKPSGRHAGKPPRDDDGPAPLAVDQRLGFRIPEWCALLGISLPSAYRAINAGELEIVEVNGIKYVPRAFAIRKGFITRDDAI
jgi:hypothetical protein